MPANAIIKLTIDKISDGENTKSDDLLVIEEPLEIRLEYGPENQRRQKNISVTMRTPGNDAELATGFLFTEGIIKSAADLANVNHFFIACSENKENVIRVSLTGDAAPALPDTDRNFYTTSSCGVCGKGSIEAIRTVGNFVHTENHTFINSDVLYRMPLSLRKHQEVFEVTGSLHASALFNPKGDLLLVREDVGRHNALDKLIGAALNKNWLPLNNKILLLSGRISFELVQKAVMAGIKIIAAVGAPSSLAVQLADEFNITLIGFLREKRFNIYTAAHRVLIPEHEIEN